MRNLKKISLVVFVLLLAVPAMINACVGTYYVCEDERVEFDYQVMRNCINGTIWELTIVTIDCPQYEQEQ